MPAPAPAADNRLAWSGLATAVLAVSWASILVRWTAAPSLTVALYRVAFAALLIAPFVPWRRWRPRPTARTFAVAAFAGLCLAIHFAAWIEALGRTSVGSAVLLGATSPLFTAALAPLLLGERIGRRGTAGLAVAVAGSFLLVRGDLAGGARALSGDALALGGALALALYLMIGRRVRRSIPFTAWFLLVNAAAAGWLWLWAAATATRLGGFAPSVWWLLLALAAGPHLVGHGLLNWSVRRLPSFTVALAGLGEPVLATLYAAILFAEVPRPSFYAGAALIAAGILLAVRERPVST